VAMALLVLSAWATLPASPLAPVAIPAESPTQVGALAQVLLWPARSAP
jgi:hypothetical protein